MKYVCLVYLDELESDGLSIAETRARVKRCEDHRVRLSERLQPSHTATTVQVRNRKVTITPGPFAETREQLEGLYVIDARDLNEAIRAAARIPSAAIGAVEVRPVRSTAGPGGPAPLPEMESESP